MKFWYKFLFLPVFVLALTGCDKETSDDNLESTEVPENVNTVDGKVTQLQKHKVGNGVPIVIMCDGFLDKDITGGRYRKATTMALNTLFSIHPMTSLKEYFDVYEVTAVSDNDFFSSYSKTAFGVKISKDSNPVVVSSNITKHDDVKAMEYAKKAIGEKRINDALIIVLINDKSSAGLCSHHGNFIKSDIPKGYTEGCSVAYVTLIDTKDFKPDCNIVLLHEAIGHGFAMLADEYVSKSGKMPDAERLDKIDSQNYGFYSNISFSSDVKKSYWANLAADSRYKSNHLACYEGAACYAKGVYRPTSNSIMNSGDSFNVVGSMMIYKRCMRLAYGDSWKFNYEDFVKFDLEGTKTGSSSKRYAPSKRSAAFQCSGFMVDSY
jgi:hypothetical protein